MRIAKFTALGMLILAFTAGGALAFHDAGVADCVGCHTMHNSQDGAPIDTTGGGDGNAFLLLRENGTDTCLRCHAGYGQFRDGTGFGPGGDFYWVTKTWTWTAHHTNFESTGDSHGHNVYSPGYGIPVESTLPNAPGGDFLSTRLGCTSCHDPHGNQSFRLLYGSALGPIYDGIRYTFGANAPVAVGNSRRTYNEDGWENNTQHTVYISGMSEWCGNCHPAIHTGATSTVHPAGRGMGSTIVGNYNAYISSDDIVNGQQGTSYWGITPFEKVNLDPVDATPENDTEGPTSSQDQVMCLSCHRSHATPFSDIGRWDFGATFINADSHPMAGDGGATADDIARRYYNYTFVDNQRALCNKCHVKDQFDGPYVPPPPPTP
jgi:hypothetical protein